MNEPKKLYRVEHGAMLHAIELFGFVHDNRSFFLCLRIVYGARIKITLAPRLKKDKIICPLPGPAGSPFHT